MQSESINFSQRARLSEWMDEPLSYAEVRAPLRDLIKVNETVFAYRPTLNWLAQITSSSNAPIHIVDVGCGAGDVLRRIESWAHRKGVAVRLTGIDHNPLAVRAAREFSGSNSRIEWVACGMSEYQPSVEIDVVISSLFTHHLLDSDIVKFLQWMERVALRGWFINDLRRGPFPYYAFKMLAFGMRWHPIVRHDGQVSVRRSFAPDDWRQYVSAAGYSAASIDIFNAWPGRLCIARVK